MGLLVLAALNTKVIFDNEEAVATSLGVKNVGCGDLEPLWLMAQSVPSASLIPCLQLVPVDWTVAEVAVNNGRSVITLDHDRGGRAAMVVRLSAACDLAGATEVTSEQRGQPAGIGPRQHPRLQVPRGCVTQRFRAAGPSALRLSDTASTEFGFITRQELRQALSQRSHGRLELDPSKDDEPPGVQVVDPVKRRVVRRSTSFGALPADVEHPSRVFAGPSAAPACRVEDREDA